MIVFPDAKMGRAHSGHTVIELTEDGTWEGFPRFAEAFTNQLGATKIDGVDGPDVRFWDIQLDGIRLNLGYDDFPNGLSLMSYSAEGDQLLQRVFDDLWQTVPEDHAIDRSPAKAVWIIAYLLSPALPFFCLRYARAIGTLECILGVLAALIAHIGLVTVLGATDGDPLQIFVILLMGLSLFVIILWQFLAGQRSGLWSADAQKQWRTTGRFFAGFLAFGMVLAIVTFHLRRNLDPEHSWIENPKAEQAGTGQPATRSLSDFQGSYNPQRVSEGRSR